MKKVRDKIVADLCQLALICNQLRKNGEKIVLTTGAFDLLHEGQLRYLEESKSFGDILIVGINDDDFVRSLKGPDRPIVEDIDRAFMVAGFGCVDYVCIFCDRLEIVESVRPDAFVMFAKSHCKPHEGNRPVQQQIVKKYGGEIKIIDESGKRKYSTSSIIEKIKGMKI